MRQIRSAYYNEKWFRDLSLDDLARALHEEVVDIDGSLTEATVFLSPAASARTVPRDQIRLVDYRSEPLTFAEIRDAMNAPSLFSWGQPDGRPFPHVASKAPHVVPPHNYAAILEVDKTGSGANERLLFRVSHDRRIGRHIEAIENTIFYSVSLANPTMTPDSVIEDRPFGISAHRWRYAIHLLLYQALQLGHDNCSAVLPYFKEEAAPHFRDAESNNPFRMPRSNFYVVEIEEGNDGGLPAMRGVFAAIALRNPFPQHENRYTSIEMDFGLDAKRWAPADATPTRSLPPLLREAPPYVEPERWIMSLRLLMQEGRRMAREARDVPRGRKKWLVSLILPLYVDPSDVLT